MGFWPVTKRVVKDSDIILLILDARMPELSRNKELERIVEYHHKNMIHVFNKTDIVSFKYLDYIKRKYPDAFFVSATRNIGINDLKKNLLIMAKKIGRKNSRIGVVGYPNVGKSAIINALAKRGKAKVSKEAGTTKGIQWVRAGSLFVLDSPGVVPFSDSEVDLGVLGAKNPEKLKNVERVALKIVRIFKEYDKRILENLYGIKTDNLNDIGEVLEEIGKKKGFLLKGGIADNHRAALFVIRDWQKGKLRL